MKKWHRVIGKPADNLRFASNMRQTLAQLVVFNDGKILGNKSPSSQQYLTTQENKTKSVLEMLHTPHRAQIDKANPVPLVLKREGGGWKCICRHTWNRDFCSQVLVPSVQFAVCNEE